MITLTELQSHCIIHICSQHHGQVPSDDQATEEPVPVVGSGLHFFGLEDDRTVADFGHNIGQMYGRYLRQRRIAGKNNIIHSPSRRIYTFQPRWLFSSHFWRLSKWMPFFEAAGAVVKIASSLKPNHHNQVKLAQIRDTLCRKKVMQNFTKG